MQGLVGAEWEFGWEMNLVILASLLLVFSQAPRAPGWRGLGRSPLAQNPSRAMSGCFILLSLRSPIPRDVRELKGPGLEKLWSLQICSQIKAVPVRGKFRISALQMLLT